MSRRRKAVFFFLGLAAVLALMAASIVAKVRRGEDLLWISELWMPAAVFSIGLVVGIEYLMAPGPKGPVAAAPTVPSTVAAAVPVPAKPAKPTRARKAPAKAKAKPAAKKTPKK